MKEKRKNVKERHDSGNIKNLLKTKETGHFSKRSLSIITKAKLVK